MGALKKIETYLVTSILDYIGAQKTLAIQLDITNACNLRCGHCYHADHKNTGAIGLTEWIQILDQYEALLNKLYLKPSFIFCGGEPLISPYLLPLMSRINKRWPDVEVSILTNGTKITEKLLVALSPYNVKFQISIDGPDASRHDQVRGQGNFDKAVEGLKLAQSSGINTKVLTVLSQKTSHWIEDFFVMARTLNLSAISFTRFIPQGAGSQLVEAGGDNALEGFELKKALEKIIQTSKDYKIKTGTNQPLYNLIDKSYGAHGHFGFQGLVVDYQGNLKVSSRADFKLGNILEDGLEPLFLKHPVMKDLRKGNIESCGKCPHYKNCGGDRNISFANTGSFLKADNGCWLHLEQKNKEGKTG